MMRYSLLNIKEPTHCLRSRHKLVIKEATSVCIGKEEQKIIICWLLFAIRILCGLPAWRRSSLSSPPPFPDSLSPERAVKVVREMRSSFGRTKSNPKEREIFWMRRREKKTCNTNKKILSAPCSLASAFSSPRPWAYLSYPVLYRRPFCFEMF